MWEELEYVGISPLNTPEEVDELMNDSQQGTTLLVVNSVCGCAAGSARPGAMLALQNDRIPGRLATVFAGVDTEATEQARSYLKDVPPSSPNIILFKDGLPVLVMQRRHIETMTAMEVARMLKDAFDQHCEAAGPSIPPEEFEKLIPVQDCGSSIPLYGEND
jgi:putative YphP/YqiW family bacilliredoxin